MPAIDDFLTAAWESAPAFGLAPEDITVLSQSENVVCDVALSDDSHVVMRLHRPGYNTLDELQSEVQWVRALGEAGLRVPTAVPTVDGDYYSSVAIRDEHRHVGVVEWVSGAPLREAPEATGAAVVAHYVAIGVLAGQIRQHSATWDRPDGFTRRRWDCDGFVGEDPLWGRFWEVDSVSADQRSLFARARSKLRDELGALSTGPDRFGLIHSDLHLGNLMADGDRLTVIDFDDAGFGWFAHELAVSLEPAVQEPWFDDCRAAILDGYRSVLPLDAEEASLIDTFLTVRTLSLVGWLDARRDLPEFSHFGDLVIAAAIAADRYLAR